MRTGYGLVVGVLAAALTGSGCCKLCDWCCWGPRDTQKINEGPPPLESPAHMADRAPQEPQIVVDQPYGGVPASQGAAGAKPAARTGTTGQTGAYGGTGN